MVVAMKSAFVAMEMAKIKRLKKGFELIFIVKSCIKISQFCKNAVFCK